MTPQRTTAARCGGIVTTVSHRVRFGATLVELLLFLAFFAVTAGVLVAFFIMTSEQRLAQTTISIVEQSGVQYLQTLENRIRASERILVPPIGESGAVLALQLTDAEQHPTVIGLSGAVLYVGEANILKQVSTSEVEIHDFSAHNTSVSAGTPSVLLQFIVSKTTPVGSQSTYARQFEALIPLFPDDEENPPCSCAVPVCSGGVFQWQYCLADVCTDASVELPCL